MLPDRIRFDMLKICVRSLVREFDWPTFLAALAEVGEAESSATVATMARSASIALELDQPQPSSPQS